MSGKKYQTFVGLQELMLQDRGPRTGPAAGNAIPCCEIQVANGARTVPH